MIVYQVWLLSMNYDLDDGMYDNLIAEFESLEDARWYFDNCPYGKHSTINTRITLEEVELNEKHESECSTTLDEVELDSYYANELEILDEMICKHIYKVQKTYFHCYAIWHKNIVCKYMSFLEYGQLEVYNEKHEIVFKGSSSDYLKSLKD